MPFSPVFTTDTDQVSDRLYPQLRTMQSMAPWYTGNPRNGTPHTSNGTSASKMRKSSSATPPSRRLACRTHKTYARSDD